jgi:hypothetical protein
MHKVPLVNSLLGPGIKEAGPPILQTKFTREFMAMQLVDQQLFPFPGVTWPTQRMKIP